MKKLKTNKGMVNFFKNFGIKKSIPNRRHPF